MNTVPRDLDSRIPAVGPERLAALDALFGLIAEDAQATVARMVSLGWPAPLAAQTYRQWITGAVRSAADRALADLLRDAA